MRLDPRLLGRIGPRSTAHVRGPVLSALTILGAASCVPLPPPPPPPPPEAPPPPKPGPGSIKGVVEYTGPAAELRVPAKLSKPGDRRTGACWAKVPFDNTLAAQGGKLQDVLVRIEVGGAPPTAPVDAPKPPRLALRDCMMAPRVQAAVAGQLLEIRNEDPLFHNVHAFRGPDTLFNMAVAVGNEPSTRDLGGVGLVRLQDDLYPWMRSFVLVADHGYASVTGADGAFAIPSVPAGKYVLEAWHARFGRKTSEVEVKADAAATVSFTFDGTESEPRDNPGEQALWAKPGHALARKLGLAPSAAAGARAAAPAWRPGPVAKREGRGGWAPSPEQARAQNDAAKRQYEVAAERERQFLFSVCKDPQDGECALKVLAALEKVCPDQIGPWCHKKALERLERQRQLDAIGAARKTPK